MAAPRLAARARGLGGRRARWRHVAHVGELGERHSSGTPSGWADRCVRWSLPVAALKKLGRLASEFRV